MTDGTFHRDMLLAAVENSQWESEPSQRMSSTGHCLRQQWYKAIGTPSGRIPPVNYWEMKDGDVHEEDVKRWLREAGYEVDREQEELCLVLSDGAKVLGHIDGQVQHGPLGLAPSLLEIKSMSYLRYVNLVKDGLRNSHPDYYLQAQGYMGAGGWPACLFIAKAKDSSATRRMLSKVEGSNPKLHMELVPFDAETFQRVRERHEIVRRAVVNEEAAPREYSLTDWQCRWCSFTKQCWEG